MDDDTVDAYASARSSNPRTKGLGFRVKGLGLGVPTLEPKLLNAELVRPEGVSGRCLFLTAGLCGIAEQ